MVNAEWRGEQKNQGKEAEIWWEGGRGNMEEIPTPSSEMGDYSLLNLFNFFPQRFERKEKGEEKPGGWGRAGKKGSSMSNASAASSDQSLDKHLEDNPLARPSGREHEK